MKYNALFIGSMLHSDNRMLNSLYRQSVAAPSSRFHVSISISIFDDFSVIHFLKIVSTCMLQIKPRLDFV